MRLHLQRNYKSFVSELSTDEISDFIVLSGVNGSGKTTMLDGIVEGSIGVDGINSPPLEGEVRLFKISELLRQAEPQNSLASYQDSWVNLKNRVEQLTIEMTSRSYGLIFDSADFHVAMRSRLLQERIVTMRVLENMERAIGKQISNFSLDDYRETAPLISGAPDLFTLSISEIFLSYHGRYTNNLLARYAQLEGQTAMSLPAPLTDDEFKEKFGEAPWITLDETLANIGLGYYSFRPPEGFERNLIYQPTLTDSRTSAEVKVDELSSGERTLLTVALTLYTGIAFEDSFELPKLLLLDEADVSLHPSMIQSLLKTIREIFHERHGVKVILTTHSPTTVALAPLESLYIMQSQGVNRLQKANTRDDALKSLTVGLPTMNVNIDARRQVFVESEVDAHCHDEIYKLLRSSISTPFSLVFIESGRGGNGSSNAVRHLVNKLQSAGNLSVRGIYDRDNRSSSPEHIHFSPERYSLENFLLDPLALGLFLLREKFRTPSAMGLPEDFVYFRFSDHAQEISDFVLNSLRQADDDPTRHTIHYSDNSTLSIESWYLNIVGHDLETRAKSIFTELNRFRSEPELKYAIIEKIFHDLPQTIPSALRALYTELSK